MSIKRYLKSTALAALLGVTVLGAFAENLVVNGDFSQGNSGFSTTYRYSFNLDGAGLYYIVNNPHGHHGYAVSYGDHTTGSGLMMAVNGNDTDPISSVWSETVSVTSSSHYTFSAWVSEWTRYAPCGAKLQFAINGTPLGPIFCVPDTAGTWGYHEVSWDSASATTARLEILHHNSVAVGDDFAIDDIVFEGTPADLVAVALAWNDTAGGVDARYRVDGGALSTATTAKLFWANGTSPANILTPSTPIVPPHTIAAGTGGPGSDGVITFNGPASAFASPFPGATHILLVLNQDGEVPESNPNNNSIALDAQELIAQSIDWGNPAGGVRFQYDVAIAPLARPTTAKLFWADGPTIGDIISANPPIVEPIYSLDTPAGSFGPIVVNVPASLFMSPPADATHILIALDHDASNPNGLIAEAREDNNVLPMRFATLKITSHRPDSIIEAPIDPNLTPSVLRYGYAVNVGKVEPRSCVLLKIQGPAGAPLRVYVTPIPNSGGHTHSGSPRPHGWFRKEQDGWRNFPPMQRPATSTTPEAGYQSGSDEHNTYADGFEVTTDNEGIAKVYYIASEFGGVEVVTAKTQAADEQQRMAAGLPLTLAIPNLAELPPSIYIAPTGEKPEHWFNHFGRADLLQALEALPVNYALETPRDTLPQNPAMRVNDMSLVTGGLFDCLGYCGGVEWQTPHKGHRFGVEVDVGLRSQPRNPTFEHILLTRRCLRPTRCSIGEGVGWAGQPEGWI